MARRRKTERGKGKDPGVDGRHYVAETVAKYE
jgi:hypothetical protein